MKCKSCGSINIIKESVTYFNSSQLELPFQLPINQLLKNINENINETENINNNEFTLESLYIDIKENEVIKLVEINDDKLIFTYLTSKVLKILYIDTFNKERYLLIKEIETI